MTGGGVTRVYQGSPMQRGRGVGSWLGGLARRIYPVLRRGLSNVAQESVHTGVNVLGDIFKGESAKHAVKRRVIDSTDKLKRKFNNYMEGLGKRRPKRRRKTRTKKRGKKYITGRGKKKSQSSKRRASKRSSHKLKKKIAKKQKKRATRKKKSKNQYNFDIFS